MRAHNDLLIRSDDSLYPRRMLRRRHFAIASQSAQIVHAFKHDHPANAGWRQHIAIEARQCIWPQSVRQQVIAADALVRDADIARLAEPCSRCASTSVQRSFPFVVAPCPSVMESPRTTTAAAPGAACTSISEIWYQ